MLSRVLLIMCIEGRPQEVLKDLSRSQDLKTDALTASPEQKRCLMHRRKLNLPFEIQLTNLRRPPIWPGVPVKQPTFVVL